jgi:hypothetical protein
VRSTAAPYTESRLTRSVANERVGFPVVEQLVSSLTSFGSAGGEALQGHSKVLAILHRGAKRAILTRVKKLSCLNSRIRRIRIQQINLKQIQADPDFATLHL